MEICFPKLDMKMIRSFCKKKVMRYAVILQKALHRTYKRYRGVCYLVEGIIQSVALITAGRIHSGFTTSSSAF